MARFSLHRTTPPIVLLTDFGFKDSYVGVMKGVIRRICRTADVIDLSHNIMPQDVAEAAFVLAASYRYFPERSIFVCVVDPGVGTERAVLYMRSNRQAFLAPDNGLLSVLAEESGRDELRRVSAQKYFLKQTSTTFHGRDVFAPVAAHLAEGVEPRELGPIVRTMRQMRLPRPMRCADGSLRGEIIYIDQFGNLITNIRDDIVERSFEVSPDQVAVGIKRRLIRGVSSTYADAGEGDLLALIGSSSYLEVAVNRGSAAGMLGCEKGDTVTLTALQEVPEGADS
ncbi:MAG: SAM hydrolase/SAM-dependent halogenase family protein [Planctomycetota bacterium]|jgi:S-adenosylmethionine hydrolase